MQNAKLNLKRCMNFKILTSFCIFTEINIHWDLNCFEVLSTEEKIL